MAAHMSPPRGNRRPRARAQRGAATTEFALLAPILLGLMVWANYFWEVQHVRLKAAEVARFVSFERTVRPDLNRITAEAMERYQDLDGATKTGELPKGLGFQNRLTLSIKAEEADAALQQESMEERGGLGGATGIIGKALGALGATAGAVAKKMGLDPSRGAVHTEVEIRIENGIIPPQIAFLATGFDDDRLDLRFTEKHFMFYDTWRAWEHGDRSDDSYARVQQHTLDRVRHIAYAGIASGGGDVLDAIGKVLSVLGLDFPFSNDFIRDSVLIRHVKDDSTAPYARGRYPTPTPNGERPTRTVPGDVLQAAYWKSDDEACFGGSCEPDEIRFKRGLKPSGEDSFDDNWPMRAYNCRGKFFQGATRSSAPESVYAQSETEGKSYHSYRDDACAVVLKQKQ
ncbi:pilus assembly protein [Myxococcus sp. K15C18031901]|uniref:TadE/TadG family type IV pilus assembly protein n=1 Tax=Myxococcus dinghuensis TaxID=2906761 RepID=UPI0020A6F641|nr:TadE/TadG family type IV pilus assembly protein [Myxococcus dinghuensis]MCP3102129.1 pilus assembly protein [Myxococcus dinghuensis]